jgi:hypothetical protein
MIEQHRFLCSSKRLSRIRVLPGNSDIHKNRIIESERGSYAWSVIPQGDSWRNCVLLELDNWNCRALAVRAS